MPRCLLRTCWLLFWLCWSSLAEAQSDALPLPPLPPEIEAEAAYLPPPAAFPVRPAPAQWPVQPPVGTFPTGQVPPQFPARPPAWPPALPVQQAAHWQPAVPSMMNGPGMPPMPYAAPPAPFANGQGVEPASYNAYLPQAAGGVNFINPAPPQGISPAPAPWQRPMHPQLPPGAPVGALTRTPVPAQPAAQPSQPRQIEFNYVAPPEAEEGTSTYMAQFDTTDDATKDQRQRARTRNFFETGVAGESRPQAGYAGRVNARN